MKVWINRLINWVSLGVIAVFFLSGCTAMQAQNPGGAYSPANATPSDKSEPLFLKGFDTVAYWTQGKHMQGSAQHSSKWNDYVFHFASAEHKALFDKEPQKYLPQFGGYCANGIAYGIPWGGDGDAWSMIDGKLYIFGGQASKDGFELDVPGNLKLAEKYWKDEVAGSNSFIQRFKRLIIRVPHYKSGEEIAKAVAAKKAQAPAAPAK
jgi:YHS domain-containing protein